MRVFDDGAFGVLVSFSSGLETGMESACLEHASTGPKLVQVSLPDFWPSSLTSGCVVRQSVTAEAQSKLLTSWPKKREGSQPLRVCFLVK